MSGGEEQGIYREELMLMLAALADINTNTKSILALLEEGEDDEDEETEDDT